jgi:beta-N-acetylhexosaminidase
MFGIYGTRPTRETVRLLKETGASGILLLARNIANPRQLRTLTRGLTEEVGRPLIFAIDHEGGWVLRFASGLTAFPGNAALGQARDPKLAYATGRQMALELAPLGIGLNLAPVVDVGTDRYNPGIGIRSFGSDAALVGRLGAAFTRGLQDHGVAACAKHFPGKGAATVDAHIALPTIRLPKAEFFRTHLAPFAAASRAGVASMMTSHVRCPAFDRKPASFSRRIVHGLIRQRMGFRGAIISDDLCMGAVTSRGPVPPAAWDAYCAGHDIVMIAHDPIAQREAVDLFRAEADAGALPAAGFRDACRRIDALLEYPRRGRAPDPQAGARLAQEVSRRAVRAVRAGALSLPLPPDRTETLVLFPDFKEVRERFTFEGGPRGPEAAVRGSLAGRGRFRILRAPIETRSVEQLRPKVRAAARVVFFCFEALRFPGQRAVLDLLNREAPRRSVVCLIRSSFDLGLLDPKLSAVDAYGYRVCQLKAACRLITQGDRP